MARRRTRKLDVEKAKAAGERLLANLDPNDEFGEPQGRRSRSSGPLSDSEKELSAENEDRLSRDSESERKRCTLERVVPKGELTPEHLLGRDVPAGLTAQIVGVFDQMFADDTIPNAAMHWSDALLQQLDPKGPLEEMAAVQAVVCHARSLAISFKAARADRESARFLNEAADRAMNTARRSLAAFAELKKVANDGKASQPAIQNNIAEQQIVVNNSVVPGKTSTNEQGDRDASDASEASQALPAQSEGTCVVEGVSSPEQAVGALHGTEDA